MLKTALVAACVGNALGFMPIHIPKAVSRSGAATPALRMSTDGLLVSRRTLLGGAAAAGLAALAPPEAAKAVEYVGPRGDGKWADHTGGFKDADFAGFDVDAETGLKYKDIVVGKGKAPDDGDIIVADYKGYTVASGDKWGDSWEDGIPRASRAGAEAKQKIMKGLNNGMLTMQPGGKRIIFIPADQGFSFMSIKSKSDPEKDVIPSFSDLVVYAEMLEVRKPANGATPGAK